jgi:hypothetical protein
MRVRSLLRQRAAARGSCSRSRLDDAADAAAQHAQLRSFVCVTACASVAQIDPLCAA